MPRIDRNAPTHQLGDLIVAAYDLGTAMVPEPPVAAALAARHLERVLVRGHNGRIIAALESLARELAPAAARPRRHAPHAATQRAA